MTEASPNDMEVWDQIVPVTGVRVLGRYVLEITFDTGEVKMIDLEPDLKGQIFEPLKADYSLFCQVRVDPEAATIVWPNGADYSPRTLYEESKPVAPI